MIAAVAALAARAADEAATVLHIDAGATNTVRVSPMLYGLMTEEINYSYEGGLYGELVRNRTFKESTNSIPHWLLVKETGADGSFSLDTNQPLSEALGTSLKLEVTHAASDQRLSIANDGFWGIPVRPNTRYHASFYARGGAGFTGPLTVSLVSNNHAAELATARVRRITGEWQKYEVTLSTGRIEPSKDNQLLISASGPGTVWLNLVSLFPPTFNNRPNGNRPDIMQLMADMKPAFLRFPGGNYLEGNTVATRFDWKKTVGDLSTRPGHYDDAWRYWSSDGMGLLEFLEWCEDLHMSPVLAVYAGYSMRQQRIAPGATLDPYVQDALDEIEYVSGDARSPWGAQRAKDGHRAPFKLEYVEIGNEDNFDRGTNSYNGRFAQFFDAIKAKHPELNVIATTRVSSRTPDLIDEHYYRNSELEMESHAHDYDQRARTGPKVFVGEWATRVGRPTPNMAGALGDSAWMTGMERNSDLVVMSSYAPLFVNVNPGGMQWPTDLIGFDTMSSYGSPGYYAQKMFSVNHGDVVLPMTADGVPTREWTPPAGRRGGNGGQAAAAQQVPTLFFDTTRDSRSGTIYLKVVNSGGTPLSVRVDISGLAKVDPKGKATVMKAASPEDTNSINDPVKVAPVTSAIDGLGASFTRVFEPYSISVLQLQGK